MAKTKKNPANRYRHKYERIKDNAFKNPDDFNDLIETGTEQRIIINEELYPRMNIVAEVAAALFDNEEFDKNDIKRFKEHLYYKDSQDPKYKSRKEAFKKSINNVLKQVMLNELYGEKSLSDINEMFNEMGFTLVRNRELPNFKN